MVADGQKQVIAFDGISDREPNSASTRETLNSELLNC